MFRTALQVSIFGFAVIATIFLVKGGLSLSLQDIAELSKPKYGYNLVVVSSLCNQKIDTMIGFIFILIAFSLQMVNLSVPMRWVDFGWNTTGTVATTVLLSVVFLMLWGVASLCSKNTNDYLQGKPKKVSNNTKRNSWQSLKREER